ncbi:MAG: hypothetical protein LBG73_06060, partial [Spirochaetaceae bacterium]|nr:hypothetical protein [Spirochaetaceae bacterium]
HYSLLITHYSLLITHYSLLITHYSLLITHARIVTSSQHSHLNFFYIFLLGRAEAGPIDPPNSRQARSKGSFFYRLIIRLNPARIPCRLREARKRFGYKELCPINS